MQIDLYLSANAGIGIDMDSTRITIDAFQSQYDYPYSTVSEELFEKLMVNPVFSAPDMVLYSHCHVDHFSRDMTRRVLDKAPSASLIIPEPDQLDGIILRDSYEVHRIGDAAVHCIRAIHSGDEFIDVPNYAYVIEKDGVSILHTGDSMVGSEELRKFLEAHGPVDVALVNFPWLAISKGRRFVQEYVKPGVTAAIHLPFTDEDASGFNAMLGRCLERWDMGDVRVMNSRLQHEVIKF